MWDRRVILRLWGRKMIKLSDYVTYREYHDQTFLLDTRQHVSFHIQAPVGKLLDLFAKETTIQAAKEQLSRRYPEVPCGVLSADVEAAAKFLSDHGLLASEKGPDTGNSQNFHTNTRYFQRYTIREKLLYSVLFEVTYRCPERCVHCYLEPSVLAEQYAKDASSELTADEICGVLDQLAEMNVMDVTFTGGEPFARDDLFEILQYAHNKGFALQIFSNGILLEESGVKRLSQMRIHCFHSSIYSHIPEKHDQITGMKGSFKKTIRVLRQLSEHGVYVNFKYVLMEQNKDDFPGVIALAKSIGASVQLISSVSPSSRGNCAITKLGVRNDEDLRRTIQLWNEISDFQSYSGAFSPDEPICEAGRNSLSINPYGIVTPCNAFRYEIGNVRKNSMSDLWNRNRKLKKWQAMTKGDLIGCQDCAYRSCCSFCPGNALNRSGNMLKKYEEACRQARIQYELKP